MLGADPALVGAEQPALEQARDARHTWHHDVRRVVVLADHGPLVRVAVLGDGPVRLPPSGVDSRAGLNDRLDERDRAVWSDVVDRVQPNPSETLGLLDLHGDRDDRLGRRFPAGHGTLDTPSSTSTRPLRRGRPGRTIGPNR
jgi:hypothetical protein